jgi:tetratricopeptide (TPR) repeat protein
MEPARRTESEAAALLASELERLGPRRAALGDAGAHAVAGWGLQHGMEWEASLLAWERVLEITPRDVEAMHAKGLCLLELARYSDAAAVFRAVIDLDASLVAAGEDSMDWMEDDPAYRLGIALHATGDLRGALAAYEDSARRNELGVDALREICRVRIVLCEPREALDAVARLERRAVRLSVRAEAMAYRAEAKAMLPGKSRG